MKEMSVQELKQKIDNKEVFQLIDVREPHEYEISNLNGELMPMGNLLNQVEEISREIPVILYCRSGGRSGAMVTELEKQFGFSNLYNLKGGIIAYAKEIDNTLTI